MQWQPSPCWSPQQPLRLQWWWPTSRLQRCRRLIYKHGMKAGGLQTRMFIGQCRNRIVRLLISVTHCLFWIRKTRTLPSEVCPEPSVYNRLDYFFPDCPDVIFLVRNKMNTRSGRRKVRKLCNFLNLLIYLTTILVLCCCVKYNLCHLCWTQFSQNIWQKDYKHDYGFV
jgi:hypothetical protein